MKAAISSLFILAAFNVLAQEHARLLNYETNYIIRSSHDAEIENNYTVLIQSEKGRNWGLFYTYSDKFRSVKSVRIIVRDGQGKQVKKLSKVDAIETGMSPSYEFDDSKLLIIDPAYQQYPYILEVSYRIKLNGFISLPVWVPQSSFSTAVEKATLNVIVYPDAEIRLREEHITVFSEATNPDGAIVKTYQVTALPHVEPTVRHKEFYKRQPKVHASPVFFQLGGVHGSASSWKAFGDWFLTLNSDPYVLKDETKNFLDGLDRADTAELVSRVYNYMQDRTRYVSIQLGIGGFKSLSTESVETTGYGDCKALTTYMKNLLDHLGIASNYILVNAGEDTHDVTTDFPSNQFNHVFLGVPLAHDTLYLECTSQILPADYTGTFTDDRHVLWISKNASELIRSRVYPPSENKVTNFASIAIRQTGDASVKLDSKNEGVFFDEIMVYKGAPEDYINTFNQARFDHYNDFAIKRFSFNQEERNRAVYHSNFVLDVPGLGKTMADKLILPANLLRPASDYIDHNEMMQYADIMRGFTISDHIEVTSENFWPIKLPEEVNVRSRFGDYKMQFRQEANKLIIERQFVFRKGTYTGSDFDDFMKTLNEIKNHEMKKVILGSKT